MTVRDFLDVINECYQIHIMSNEKEVFTIDYYEFTLDEKKELERYLDEKITHIEVGSYFKEFGVWLNSWQDITIFINDNDINKIMNSFCESEEM